MRTLRSARCIAKNAGPRAGPAFLRSGEFHQVRGKESVKMSGSRAGGGIDELKSSARRRNLTHAGTFLLTLLLRASAK